MGHAIRVIYVKERTVLTIVILKLACVFVRIYATAIAMKMGYVNAQQHVKLVVMIKLVNAIVRLNAMASAMKMDHVLIQKITTTIT